jgi:RNA polymerase sigma factor (sigma-70 family)
LTKIIKRSKGFKDKSYWISAWLRFSSGDRFAFEEIYTEFIDVLFSYGSKMTHDKELIKDSVQDLFIDLYRYKIDLRQPESFEYYLFKALKRLIQKKLKRKSKTRDFETGDFFAFELTFNLEEDYIQKESEKSKLIVLQEILNELSREQRELLFYKFNSNLTYKEIGKLIGMTPDAVKKRIYRLISSLRKTYNIKTFHSEVIQF